MPCSSNTRARARSTGWANAVIRRSFPREHHVQTSRSAYVSWGARRRHRLRLEPAAPIAATLAIAELGRAAPLVLTARDAAVAALERARSVSTRFGTPSLGYSRA